MKGFNHALNAAFIERLAEKAAKGGWWKDVLNDDQLFIAVRGNSLDVYYRGQRLFHVSGSGVKVTTHEKFRLDPALKSQVLLRNDGSFDVASLIRRGFVGRYESQ